MVFVPIIPPEERKVHYKCGKCGRETERDSVLQCPVCFASICDQCSNYSFCNEHFNLLTQDDKNTIIENYRPRSSRNKNQILIFLIAGLLVFGLGALFFYRNIDFGGFESPIVIFILIGIIGIGGIAAAFLSKSRNTSINSRFDYIASQIAKNYQNSSEKDDTKSYSSNKAINLKYCSKCGNLSEKGSFCPQCGEKLL